MIRFSSEVTRAFLALKISNKNITAKNSSNKNKNSAAKREKPWDEIGKICIRAAPLKELFCHLIEK